MKNGLIYTIMDWILEKLKYLNLVELFKFIAKEIYTSDKRLASRAGVDIYILLKWLIIIILWSCGISNKFANIFTFYLIATNLYTYFYYHTWTKDLEKGNFDFDRIKRRFLNLILAFSFNILCFAYLFAIPYMSDFQWTNQLYQTKDSLLFSIANSLTVDFSPVQIITHAGQTLTLMETVITFFFLTIILSNSIPQIKTN